MTLQETKEYFREYYTTYETSWGRREEGDGDVGAECCEAMENEMALMPEYKDLSDEEFRRLWDEVSDYAIFGP